MHKWGYSRTQGTCTDEEKEQKKSSCSTQVHIQSGRLRRGLRACWGWTVVPDIFARAEGLCKRNRSKKKTIKNRERGKTSVHRKVESCLFWAEQLRPTTATLPQLCWHCFHYTYFHHTPGTTNLRWAKKGEKEKLKQDKREGARCLLREGEMELQQTTRLFLATRKSLAEYKKKKKRDDLKRTFWLAGSTWLACSEQAQNTVGERKKTLCLTLRAASMTEHNNLKPKQKTRRKKKKRRSFAQKRQKEKKKKGSWCIYVRMYVTFFFLGKSSSWLAPRCSKANQLEVIVNRKARPKEKKNTILSNVVHDQIRYQKKKTL